jgi:hypothetical protein
MASFPSDAALRQAALFNELRLHFPTAQTLADPTQVGLTLFGARNRRCAISTCEALCSKREQVHLAVA